MHQLDLQSAQLLLVGFYLHLLGVGKAARSERPVVDLLGQIVQFEVELAPVGLAWLAVGHGTFSVQA